MELLSKVCTALLFGVTVILVSAAVIFTVITVEFKVLTSKRKRIQAQLTKEEQRLIELSDLVTQSMVSVNDYISELTRKRQELADRKCNCTHLPTSNTEHQKE